MVDLRSAESLKQIFPLELTPFEKFVLWDETPECPMTSFVQLKFASPLVVSRLEDALSWSVGRHSLLSSHIVESGGKLAWQPIAEFRQHVSSTGGSRVLEAGQVRPIDLFRENGLRCWYGKVDEVETLTLQVHHACCDGVGLRRVLLDVLTAYAASTPPNDLPNGPRTTSIPRPEAQMSLEPERLLHRADFSATFRGPPTRKLTFGQRLRNAHYFHFQPPDALHSCEPEIGYKIENSDKLAPQSAQCYADLPLQTAVIGRETSKQILEACRVSGLQVNDLAVALLFQTCSQWNQRATCKVRRKRLRLLVPYDLRSRIDLRMPAANRLSFAFLGRTYDQCSDLPSLLSSVQAEMRAIKDSQLPLDFLNALAAASQHPRSMRWILRNSSRMATAVLTYTGDISRGMAKYFPEAGEARLVGDAALTQILAVPPVRRNTHVAIGLCINWGQLCIAAAWNRQAWKAEDCRRFLAAYQANWSAWLQAQEHA